MLAPSVGAEVKEDDDEELDEEQGGGVKLRPRKVRTKTKISKQKFQNKNFKTKISKQKHKNKYFKTMNNV
jgi:hypothetical protein